MRKEYCISDIMSNTFSCDVYATNSGLGYDEYAYLLKLEKTENGHNYLVIDSYEKCSVENKEYIIGSITKDLEPLYVTKVENYDFKNCELWGNFLFHFFLKEYCS